MKIGGGGVAWGDAICDGGRGKFGRVMVQECGTEVMAQECGVLLNVVWG